MDHSLSTYFKWVLSFIFVAAGILKMFRPDNTGDILNFLFAVEYNTSQIIVYTIATIEVLLGVCLFFGIKDNITRSLILFSSLIFLAIAILGFLDNWNMTCGCFGRFSFGRFDGMMVFRNSLMVFMSFWIIYDHSILNKLTSKEVNN